MPIKYTKWLLNMVNYVDGCKYECEAGIQGRKRDAPNKIHLRHPYI